MPATAAACTASGTGRTPGVSLPDSNRENSAPGQGPGVSDSLPDGRRDRPLPPSQGISVPGGGHGFTFNLVTNGHRFRENLLPVLSSPDIQEGLTEVCFSLDGARPETHDALRGPGSFREVMEASTLCRLKGIPSA